MALKCAVELGIAGIINSEGQGQLITLSQIAAKIASPTTNLDHLSRLMKFLARKKVFKATTDAKTGDTLYGLTCSSMWLFSNEEQSLVPLVLMANQPHHIASWHCISKCITEGGSGFEKANGFSLYDFSSEISELGNYFKEGMACTSRIVMKAILSNYKDGFEGVGLIAHVGGSIGAAMAEIVNAHPHIRGINFDLPDVVARAPRYPDVTQLGIGSPPKQMVEILMTTQHGLLDFDQTATIIITFRETPPVCSRWIKIQRPVLCDHEDPHHLLRRGSNSTNLGGDMFDAIPNADAIFMKVK